MIIGKNISEVSNTSLIDPQFGICQSFKDIIQAAAFPITALVAFQMIGMLNIYFVGHIGNPDLIAGVGMGTMLLNVLCFALSQGLNGGIETFVSQDMGAAKKSLYKVNASAERRARVS
jgi:Na+-driven multidrug efflux pump